MKKIAMLATGSALALAAVTANAEMSTNYYGYILASVNDNDGSVNADGQGANGPSRFGFTSSYELDGGLSAGAQLEYAVSTNTGSIEQANAPGLRLANAHLAGDFGSIKVGTQWNPMYLWTTGTTDLFLSDAFGDARASDVTFRQDGAVFYTSPDFSGLQLQVGGILEDGKDSAGNRSSGFDSYTVAAKYTMGNLYASVSYLTIDGGDQDDADLLGIAVSYDYGFGTIAASMTDQNDTDGVSQQPDNKGELEASGRHNSMIGNNSPYELVATYNATPNWTLKAAYANKDLDGGNDSSMAVEAEYAFSDQVSTAFGVGMPDDNFDGTGDTVSAALFVAF